MKRNGRNTSSQERKSDSRLIRVKSVRPLKGFSADFTFTDGTERDIDLDRYLWGPVFEPIRNDSARFRQMYVARGTIAWSDEVDIDPDTLYYGDAPIPWMVEYEERQKKKKARQRRELRAPKSAAQRTTKSSPRKKSAAKTSSKKTVMAKKK